MRVELSGLAERDLLDIALNIADDNPDRAFSFVDELQDACADLAENPLRFALLPGFEEHGLRRRIHGRYIIVYRVEKQAIHVLRVMSTAMDLDQALLGN